MSNQIFAHGIIKDVSKESGFHLLISHGGSRTDIWNRLDQIQYPDVEVNNHKLCKPFSRLHWPRQIKLFDAQKYWATEAIVSAMSSRIAMSVTNLNPVERLIITRTQQGPHNHFNDSFEFLSSGNHLLALNLPNYSGAGSTANAQLRSLFMAVSCMRDIEIENVLIERTFVNS